MIYIVFRLIKSSNETSFSVNGDAVILEETTSTRKEMLHDGIKEISQNHVVLTCRG